MLWTLVGFKVYDYQKEHYYRPSKMFISPTAEVLPGGVVWLYGGFSFKNWTSYGIGQGVFNVGLADIVEVRVSLERMLLNVYREGMGGFATAMKIRALNLPNFKVGVELKISPYTSSSFADTLVVYNEVIKSYEFYGFTRSYRSRSATLTLPLSLYHKNFVLSVGGTFSQYGTFISVEGFLPDTSDDCAANPHLSCESLKEVYRSRGFAPSLKEERSNYYGGYLGLIYHRNEKTDLLLEITTLPVVVYRGTLKDTSKSSPEEKWGLNNRYTSTRFNTAFLFISGLRYSFNRYVSFETGVFIPYFMGQDTPDLLSATIYSNLNLIFGLGDMKGFFW